MLGMNGPCECVKSTEECGRGSIEEFVRDAIDAVIARGVGLGPLTVADNLFEWNAISRATPGGDDDLGIGTADCVGICMLARITQKLATSGFNEFSDPRLRMDDGLAPFFAKDGRFGERGSSLADGVDFALHGGYELGAAVRRTDDSGDGGHVGIYIGERARCESEEANTGF